MRSKLSQQVIKKHVYLVHLLRWFLKDFGLKLERFFDTFLKKREMDKNVDFSTSSKRDAHFQGSRAPKSEEISILGPPQNRSHFKATLLKDFGDLWAAK